MRKTIILGNISESEIGNKIDSKRELYRATQISDSFIYHLNNQEVDSYIIDYNSYSIDKTSKLIEQFLYLNHLINIAIYKPDALGKTRFNNSENVYLLYNNEFNSFFNQIDPNNRLFNRVNWPLLAEVRRNSTSSIVYKGMVLSISAGGCFIKLDEEFRVSENEVVIITLRFKQFCFLTEGITRRVKKLRNSTINGIAFEFKDVSTQTSKYIKEIIDEEILSEIMEAVQ